MPSQLWQRIRAIRKHLGETQEQFALRFGVSKSAVSQWESDNAETRTAPELPTTLAMARVTGAPLDWMFDDDADLDAEWWSYEVPRPPPSVTVVLEQLAAYLAPLDSDGRQSAASLLAAWAADPPGKKSNAMLLAHLLGPRAGDAHVAQHIKPAPKLGMPESRPPNKKGGS